MKYLIKLNNKIISRRNTIRTYNYAWVRVVQKKETTYFYKNTGETIEVGDYFKSKKITLNGQKVDKATKENPNGVPLMNFISHIDKSKTITKILNDNYIFNECSKYLCDSWKNWKQDRLLFSKSGKFSEPVNGVRTLKFNY